MTPPSLLAVPWALVEDDHSFRIVDRNRDLVASIPRTLNASEELAEQERVMAATLAVAPEIVAMLFRCHEFISNGIEFGYIRPAMYPDDPATATPDLVRELVYRLWKGGAS